ncbi:hypothetical protein AB9C39_25870 [Klebsiella pneumoniae]|uniref:hypothetical protein n=1 Tax=Klebsiella pneumoniae TaxID=573 RepID=UPI00350FB4EA
MTSKLTKERLQEIAEDGFLKHGESKELARMALAAMDIEPVILYRQVNPANGMKTYWAELDPEEFRHLKKYTDENAEFMTLYRHAQPAPVVEREPIAWLNDAYLARGVVDGEAGSEDAGPGYIPVYREAGPQPAPVITFYRDGIEAAAKWIDQQREAYDIEHGWSDPDTGAFEFGNDAQRGYSSTLEELAEGIRALHPNAGNSPTIPEGYVMVPMRLTAENGAKGSLSGEFSETKFVNCPECFGDDECETCDGSGRIEITVPVTWTTIKEIWAKGVEHFAPAPQEVK